jgi:hypothetical protein
MGAPPKPNKISTYIARILLHVLTSHEESEHDELTQICRDGCSDREDNEQEVAAVIQWKSTIHLRQWRDN